MRTRIGRVAAAVGLVLAAVVALVAVPQMSAGAAGTVALSPSSGPVGTTVSFSGANCITEYGAENTGDNIRAYFREWSPASPMIGLGTVDVGSPNRAFSGTFEIPDKYYTPVGQEFEVTPGTYTIAFDCSTFVYPNTDMTATFTVTGSGSTTTTTTTTIAPTPPSTTPPSTTPPATAPGGGDFVPPPAPPGNAAPFATPPAGSVLPGGSITLDEPGFRPGEEVDVVVYSDPFVLGQTTADASGVVAASYEVPDDLPAGEHTLVLYGSETVKATSLTVGAPSAAAGPAAPARPTRVAAVSLTG